MTDQKFKKIWLKFYKAMQFGPKAHGARLISLDDFKANGKFGDAHWQCVPKVEPENHVWYVTAEEFAPRLLVKLNEYLSFCDEMVRRSNAGDGESFAIPEDLSKVEVMPPQAFAKKPKSSKKEAN